MADLTTNSIMSATVWGMTPQKAGLDAGGPFANRAGGDAWNKIIDRRHPEWRNQQIRWRWLVDSYEGGEAYRQNIYGWDLTGLPIYNLIRHKREYPEPYEQNYYGLLGRPPGSDQYAQATNSDFELRRARTPIPMFVRRAIKTHLSKIYKQEIHRDNAPPKLQEWLANVDGSNTPFDAWMKETFAPLLESLGQLDLIFDHPPAPKGATIESKADTLRLDLDRVVVSYILPENLVWWDLNRNGTYREALVCEPQEQAGPAYRFWQEDRWTLFSFQGKKLDEQPHPYGRPPIVRIFDERRPRAKNIGMPRYEELAELQREYYNTDSERILSDTIHAHPLIQGAEDWVKADGTVPIGPSWLLPKKKNIINGAATYEPFEVLDFPSTSSEKLNESKRDLENRADRSAHLTKPAGAAHGDGKTIGQSGISKRLDAHDGNDYLAEIAGVLERAEKQIIEMWSLVANDGAIDTKLIGAVTIRYPRDFDLFSPDELTDLITDWQTTLAGAGATPLADVEMLCRLFRLIVKGLCDEEYAAIDKEIEAYVKAAAKMKGLEAEANTAQLAVQAAMVPGENVPAQSSEPEGINAASLAAAGTLVQQMY